LLSDKLDDPRTANLVIDRITAYSLTSSLVPDSNAVNLAYDSTDDGNPLRKALRDLIIQHISCYFFEDLPAGDYHEDLRDDVERAYQMHRNGTWDGRSHFPSGQTCSYYHLHHESFPRSKCHSK
jgi:hypothetical protein